MIKKTILALALLMAPACIMAISQPAPAQALFEDSIKQACSGAELSDTTNADCKDEKKGAGRIQSVVQSIVDILTIIVGIAAVITIILNGFKFITSGGDSSSISAARNGIIYAIVGLIVVALAQAIVRFVINKI